MERCLLDRMRARGIQVPHAALPKAVTHRADHPTQISQATRLSSQVRIAHHHPCVRPLDNMSPQKPDDCLIAHPSELTPLRKTALDMANDGRVGGNDPELVNRLRAWLQQTKRMLTGNELNEFQVALRDLISAKAVAAGKEDEVFLACVGDVLRRLARLLCAAASQERGLNETWVVGFEECLPRGCRNRWREEVVVQTASVAASRLQGCDAGGETAAKRRRRETHAPHGNNALDPRRKKCRGSIARGEADVSISIANPGEDAADKVASRQAMIEEEARRLAEVAAEEFRREQEEEALRQAIIEEEVRQLADAVANGRQQGEENDSRGQPVLEEDTTRLADAMAEESRHSRQEQVERLPQQPSADTLEIGAAEDTIALEMSTRTTRSGGCGDEDADTVASQLRKEEWGRKGSSEQTMQNNCLSVEETSTQHVALTCTTSNRDSAFVSGEGLLSGKFAEDATDVVVEVRCELETYLTKDNVLGKSDEDTEQYRDAENHTAVNQVALKDDEELERNIEDKAEQECEVEPNMEDKSTLSTSDAHFDVHRQHSSELCAGTIQNDNTLFRDDCNPSRGGKQDQVVVFEFDWNRSPITPPSTEANVIGNIVAEEITSGYEHTGTCSQTIDDGAQDNRLEPFTNTDEIEHVAKSDAYENHDSQMTSDEESEVEFHGEWAWKHALKDALEMKAKAKDASVVIPIAHDAVESATGNGIYNPNVLSEPNIGLNQGDLASDLNNCIEEFKQSPDRSVALLVTEFDAHVPTPSCVLESVVGDVMISDGAVALEIEKPKDASVEDVASHAPIDERVADEGESGRRLSFGLANERPPATPLRSGTGLGLFASPLRLGATNCVGHNPDDGVKNQGGTATLQRSIQKASKWCRSVTNRRSVAGSASGLRQSARKSLRSRSRRRSTGGTSLPSNPVDSQSAGSGNPDDLGVTSTNIETCSICCDEVPEQKAYRLSCQHGWYCSYCMLRHAEARLDVGAVQVNCPECNAELAERELRRILPDRIIDRLQARSLEQAVSAISDLCACPTPNCPMRVALEEGEPPRLKCPLCRKESCLRCGAQPFHKRQTCAQYAVAKRKKCSKGQEADESFQQWLEETGTKRCPNCSAAISKNNLEKQATQQAECHKMLCRCCSTRFCFKCLAVLSNDFTCGCSIDAHGFVDPITGQRLDHLKKVGRPRGVISEVVGNRCGRPKGGKKPR